jgi:hypothetical protein
MKPFTIAFGWLLFFSLPLAAQNIDSTISTYAGKYAQERCYLHYDKSSYVPGETVWFKVYLMKGIFPADDSKNFYIDWTDDKGILLFRNVSPVVDATTNGQFDIPTGYSGKFIHVKAYTKWMLNFDSDFVYHKDIRILSKNTGSTASKNDPVPTLQFFPEGGDAVAGVVNKIAFKANDQWGNPVKIKGIIQNNQGITMDSIRVIHDGMGYFFLTPKPGETFTAKWKDEKGAEHTTSLPPVKSTGISLQVLVAKTKQQFIIRAADTLAPNLQHLHIIGTLNQNEIFKVSKDIESGIAQATVPTQNLPTGILTITVFDNQWNALAERISYINNEDYLFQTEMNVVHWGLNKRARNEIQVLVPDSLPANFSVAVTDAGIDADSSDDIISHLLLTGDIKGQVYHPSYYFSNTSDSVSRHLDLVMLTHGWRRFNWEEVVKGKLPKINFPRDTSYLTISGRLYGAMPSQVFSGANIILIMNQKNVKGKMMVLPIESNATFNDPSFILMDTAHIYYRLSKGLEDVSVGFMENRLPTPRYNTAASGLFYSPSDTAGSYRHFQLSDEALQLMKLYEGKVLENVVIKAKTKTPLQILDEKYSSGLFAGGDSYQFDLLNDPFSGSSPDIFTYLQGKVAGLQITTGATPSLQWRGGVPQLYVDEVPTDVNLVSSIAVTDVAYIKVFRPPFFGGSGNAGNGGIAIYTRRGDDTKPVPGKGLANNTIMGYTAARQFYSPNYSSFNTTNDKKDIRTTLYWNPQVTTSYQKNQVVLSFYNNDVSKAFRVVIEGMGKDGRLTHLEQIME